MENDERATGIILEAKPFEECHRIVTIFTFEHGLIKLFIQNALKKWLVVQPFCKMELLYKKGKNGLDYFTDGKLLKVFPAINSEDPSRGLLEIQLTSRIAKTLLLSQCARSIDPKLYLLFEAYLTTLPLVAHPENLLRSFQLKLLVHEGILLIENRCRDCKELLVDSYYSMGEPFCKLHAKEHCFLFAQNEIESLHALATSKSISEVDDLLFTSEFGEKIESFYEHLRIK